MLTPQDEVAITLCASCAQGCEGDTPEKVFKDAARLSRDNGMILNEEHQLKGAMLAFYSAAKGDDEEEKRQRSIEHLNQSSIMLDSLMAGIVPNMPEDFNERDVYPLVKWWKESK